MAEGGAPAGSGHGTAKTGHLNFSAAQAHGVAAFAIFLWAVGLVVARGVNDTVPPIGLSFWRWLIAALIVFPFIRKDLVRGWPVIRAHLPLLATQGVLLVGSGAMVFVALGFTTATNTALISTAQPAVTLAVAWRLIGDKLRPVQMAGMAVALLGVGLMIIRADLAQLRALDFNPGDILVVLSLLFYSLYAVNTKRLPGDLGLFSALFVVMIAGCIALLPVYIWESVTLRPVPLAAETFWSVGALALVISILAMALWNSVNRIIGPNRAAAFINLFPVYGAILGVTFLGEEIFAFHFIGAALIMAGIFLVVRRGLRRGS